ncbi:MAG: nucleotide exchange factor GrpE [Pseudomonadota bacterium]
MSDKKDKVDEVSAADEVAEATATVTAAAEAAAEDADIAFDFGDLESAAELADGAMADPGAAEEIAQLTAERDELKEKLMRALAEAENTRRRAERDRKDAATFAGTKLARDILSVHDNMERALAAADDAAKAAASGLIEGVELTQRELLSAFAKHQIEMVSPEAGEKFDPNLHQAMFEAPAPGAEPGTVIEVMQSGFTIAGRLLRPALVGVAKAG